MVSKHLRIWGKRVAKGSEDAWWYGLEIEMGRDPRAVAGFLILRAFIIARPHAKLYTLCSEKTPTHIIFHISMNDV